MSIYLQGEGGGRGVRNGLAAIVGGNNMKDATAVPGRPAGKTAQPVPLNLSIDPASTARFLDLVLEALDPMIAKALSQVHAATATQQQAAELPPPPTATAKGVDLKPTDQLKAADLRVALLMGKIPEDTGLLIDKRVFARLLDIGVSTLERFQAGEAIPAPVRIGSVKRWRLAEILEWIEADCPPQRVWVHRRQDSARKKEK